MENTITISDIKLPQVAYSGVPVITTDYLAMAYGTEPVNIQKGYDRHQSRFTEKKHYFKVAGTGLKQFRQQVAGSSLDISPKTRHLMLWTERGAARHAKILETDRAWDMFELMEDFYFKPQPIQTEQPTLPAPAVEANPECKTCTLERISERQCKQIHARLKHFDSIRGNFHCTKSALEAATDHLIAAMNSASLRGIKKHQFTEAMVELDRMQHQSELFRSAVEHIELMFFSSGFRFGQDLRRMTALPAPASTSDDLDKTLSQMSGVIASLLIEDHYQRMSADVLANNIWCLQSLTDQAISLTSR